MTRTEFDTELLRLVGGLRTTILSLDGPEVQATALPWLAQAVERAEASHANVSDLLAALESALRGAVEDARDVRAETVAVLEALEGLVVEPESAEWAAAFGERISLLEAAAASTASTVHVGAKGEGDEHADATDDIVGALDSDVDGPGSLALQCDDPSMHGLASHLVQMDSASAEALPVLRDHLASAIEAWRGSDLIGERLREALAGLDAVVADPASDASERTALVERLAEVVEAAILQEEDAALLAEVDAEALESQPEERSVPAAAPSAARQAVVVSADADPELVVEFVAEGLEYLDHAETALLSLEHDPSDAEAINVTFRAFHTIKGVAAFLALEEVTSLSHHAETLLEQLRSGALSFTGTAADLLLRSADILRALLIGTREVVGGGSADIPDGFCLLMEELTDPDLAERVASDDDGGASAATGSPEADSADSERVSATRVEDSVRIRTDRLDRLVDLVGELVVAQSLIAQDPEVVGARGSLGRKVDHSQKILRDLQALSTSLRMVPLKPAFHKISRVVRDVSQKSGKRVELVTKGVDTELDRSMVGVVTDPLVHMVRNAIDHGIESAEERLAAGKPEHGTIRLSARHAGGNVVVEIEDDGRGLDRDKIVAKAVERGLIEADRVPDDSEVFNLIFHAGFSTAKEVTDISGRGVGMDVVRRAVESLRGRVEIGSELGKGTRFSIYLPLTLAITDGMLIQIGAQRFIVPTQKIQVSLRPTEDDLWSVSQKGEMVMLHEQLIPIARLHRLYGIEGAKENPTEALLVVVGEGSRKTALLVDQLLGQQQFVVKALTDQVAGTPGVAGGAILGDGTVGLILDPDELVGLARHGESGRSAA